MAKISDLPVKANPTGDETVLILDAGVAKRASLAAIIANAITTRLAAALTAIDNAKTAAIAALQTVVASAETARDRSQYWAGQAENAIATVAVPVPTPAYATATEALDGSVAWGVEPVSGDVRVGRVKPVAIDQMPTRSYVTRREFNRVRYRAALHSTSWMGQSKIQTSAMGAPHNTTQRYGMLAFPFHTAAAAPAALPLLGTSQEVNGSTAYGGATVAGESPMHGMVYAGELAERQHGVVLDQVNVIMVVTNNATGSTSLLSNARGGSTANFEHTIMQATAGKALAASMGLPFVMEAVMWSQGEGGSGYGSAPPNGVGYTYAENKLALKNLQIDLDTTIRGITGGTNPVNLLCVQVNTPSGGGAAIANDPFNVAQAQLDAYHEFAAAPVRVLAAATTAAAAQGAATLAFAANANIVRGMMLAGAGLALGTTVAAIVSVGGTTTVTLSAPATAAIAAGANVTFTAAAIIVVTPEYMLEYANTLHYPARDALWVGAYLALAYHRTVIEGVRWQPLDFEVEQVIGNFVHLRAIGNEGPLVIDNDFLPAQVDAVQGMRMGFTCRTPGGAIVPVNSVRRGGTDGIIVELASAPAGNILKYAKNAAVGRPGGYVGGCGNIRDSLGDRLPVFEGNGVNRRMHKWAVANQWSL